MKHFDLPFIRYDLPPLPSTPSSPSTYLGSHTTKPRAPTLRYRLLVPAIPIGPQDLVSVSLSLQPVDSAVSIRSASLIVERRLQLHETIASSSSLSPPPTLPIPIISSSSSHPQCHSAPASYSPTTPSLENSYNPVLNGAYLSPYSSPPSVSPSPFTSTVWSEETTRPLLSNTSPTHHLFSAAQVPSKTVTQSIAGVESSGSFTSDDKGVWAKTLTLQWPSARSHTRWAMGETMQTELASVKFFVRVKVRLKAIFLGLACMITIYLLRSSYHHLQALNPSILRSRNSPSSPRTKPNVNLRYLNTTNSYTLLIALLLVRNLNRLGGLDVNATRCPHRQGAPT